MPQTVEQLIDLLDLERLEVGLFRGSQPPQSTMTRVYGGQVAAQALVAAQQTVDEDRFVHSLHVYFVLGGDPSIPIIYDVENVRDGRSFTTRRVAARQHGEIIFYMTASFQRSEEGLEHQDLMPEVPDPDQAPSLSEVISSFDAESGEHWAQEWSAMDMRYVGDNRARDDQDRILHPSAQRFWFRTGGALDDDIRTHNAALLYMSDLTLLSASLVLHRVNFGDRRFKPASLDHVVWFHRPFRADQWLLYDQRSPSASGARGLSTARIFTRDGSLAATVAQEGLMRPPR